MITYPKRRTLAMRNMAAILSVSISSLLVGATAHAATCGGIETAILTCADGSEPIFEVIKLILQITVGVIGIAAVGGIIWAGILYGSAGGDVARVQKAKTIIRDTIIGIIAFGCMVLFVNFLVPGGVFGEGASSLSFSGPSGTGSQSGNGSSIISSGSGTTTSGGNTNSTATTTSQLTFTTWNIKGDYDHSITSPVKTLLQQSQVVGLQEVHRQSVRKELSNLTCSSCSYAGYIKTSSGSDGSDPILWNKSLFTKMDSGRQYMSSPPSLTVRYATWVRLADKKTKKSFYVINTHTPPGIQYGDGWDSGNTGLISAFKQHMKNLSALVSSKRASGDPVFVIGDFNIDYRRDKACKIAEWPCQTLGKKYGIYAAWYYTNFTGVASGDSTHSSSSRLIDYIMVPKRSDITVRSTKIINASSSSWGGSDHKPSLATIDLSSTSTSGSSSGSNTGTSITPTNQSTVTLSGVYNFRDTALSGVIKPGILYRSGRLMDATASDVTTLSKLLKNGQIIDLRTPSTVSSEPDKVIPGTTRVSAPVTGTVNYTKFVTDSYSIKGFQKALNTIATSNGPYLIHCTLGRDRTGWIIAMIMYIMGASDSQVMTEYMRSNGNLPSGYSVKASNLNAGLSKARQQYGSIDNYLRQGLGLSDATLNAIRTKLKG